MATRGSKAVVRATGLCLGGKSVDAVVALGGDVSAMAGLNVVGDVPEEFGVTAHTRFFPAGSAYPTSVISRDPGWPPSRASLAAAC